VPKISAPCIPEDRMLVDDEKGDEEEKAEIES